MVGSEAVSVSPRLDQPEIAGLVRDVTKTLSFVAAACGVDFAPASHEEADAIASPAARMLGKNAKVARVIRQVSDPVVLVGAVIALFAVRSFARKRDRTSPTAVQLRSVPAGASSAPVGKAAAPSVTASTVPPPPPAAVVAAPPSIEQQLRDSVLDRIAAQGFGAVG